MRVSKDQRGYRKATRHGGDDCSNQLIGSLGDQTVWYLADRTALLTVSMACLFVCLFVCLID